MSGQTNKFTIGSLSPLGNNLWLRRELGAEKVYSRVEYNCIPARIWTGNTAPRPHTRNVTCRQPFSLPVDCHAQNAYAYADWRARYASHVPGARDQSDCVSFASDKPLGKVFDPASIARARIATRLAAYSFLEILGAVLKSGRLGAPRSIAAPAEIIEQRENKKREIRARRGIFLPLDRWNDHFAHSLHTVVILLAGTVWSVRLITSKSRTLARTTSCTPAITTRSTVRCRCQCDGWPGSRYFW